MKIRFKKILSIVLLSVILCSILFGCSSNSGKDAGSNDQTTISSSSDSSNSTSSGSGSMKITDKPITLKYWTLLSSYVATQFKSLGDTKLYKKLEEITGIHMEFQHPPIGQENEQFKLIVASGDLPDIIDYSDFDKNYPGGAEKAINDNIIISLNNYSQYAPNIMKYLNSNQLYIKTMTTDSGNMFAIPFSKPTKFLQVYAGPQLRGDWLKELGLDIPETIDEWENVLKQFRDKKNIIPLTIQIDWIKRSAAFIGAFGIPYNYYVDNGKVQYGPMQPGYKDFLMLMNKWYKEKLLDADFAIQDSKTYNAKITGSKAASYIGSMAGNMAAFMTTARVQEPGYTLVGAPYPVLKEGDAPLFGQSTWPVQAHAVITPKNKYPVETVKWFDYGFSAEGQLLYNFGIEGESYNMVDGKPVFTDNITKNSEGLPMSTTLSDYSRTHYSGPFVQMDAAIEQYMTYTEQADAVKRWLMPDNSKYLPPVTPTSEESSKLAASVSQINTYVDEMLIKFIVGQEPIDKFDQYVDKLKQMNIDEVLKIYQDALYRFNNR